MNAWRFYRVVLLGCLVGLATGTSKALTVNFTKAGQAPAITASGYTIPVGTTVSFTLGFAPLPGTAFTVVNNTGLAFINGEFQNLTQGAEVALPYAGTTFKFVANYFGGNGNDLVLEWEGTRAVAWGGNNNGELGKTGGASRIPVSVDRTGVLAGKTIIDLAAGDGFSLALCSDGTVASWGFNGNGQLGIHSSSDSHVPVAVDLTGVLAGKKVVALSAGEAHSLALCSDGTVAAWGGDRYGQLGNNDPSQSLQTVPVLVSTQSGVSALYNEKVVSICAANNSLALCQDGRVAAWGTGWLGNQSTSGGSLVPVRAVGLLFSPLSGRGISCGVRHSLALSSAGYLLAWGDNSYGELGDDSKTNRGLPVPVVGYGVLHNKPILQVAAGWDGSLALCSDGTLASWGSNLNGELGDGEAANDSKVPVAVPRSGPALAGKTVVAISSGSFHRLVLCSDGTAAGWGSNSGGELGDGTITPRPTPVAVSMAGLAPGERFVKVISGPLSTHIAWVPSPPCPMRPLSPSTKALAGAAP